MKKNPNEKFFEKNYTDIEPKYYDVIIRGMEKVVQSGTAAGSKIKDIIIAVKPEPHRILEKITLFLLGMHQRITRKLLLE